jgi:hypothetical protein
MPLFFPKSVWSMVVRSGVLALMTVVI